MDSSRLFKPWLIIPPTVLGDLLLAVAILMTGLGVHSAFLRHLRL